MESGERDSLSSHVAKRVSCKSVPQECVTRVSNNVWPLCFQVLVFIRVRGPHLALRMGTPVFLGNSAPNRGSSHFLFLGFAVNPVVVSLRCPPDPTLDAFFQSASDKVPIDGVFGEKSYILTIEPKEAGQCRMQIAGGGSEVGRQIVGCLLNSKFLPA